MKRPIEILWHFGVWLWTGCKKEECRWTNSSGNLWNFRWLGWRLNCNGEIELNCGGGRKLTAGVQQFLLCLTKRGKRGRRDCSERAEVLSQVWETTQILQIIISCLFRSARTSYRTFVRPSVHPSTRANFSWVHRWAEPLPSGLRDPSNRIFSESPWCQLSKFGQNTNTETNTKTIPDICHFFYTGKIFGE